MDNQQRVRYFYDVITTNHLLDEMGDYIAKACTLRIGEELIPVGLEGMRQHMAEVRKTYPDFRMRITRQFCDGDTVISEFVAEGTHLGEWLGMKPSGKTITMTGVDIDRMQDGKIVEHGGAVNTLEALLAAELIQPVP